MLASVKVELSRMSASSSMAASRSSFNTSIEKAVVSMSVQAFDFPPKSAICSLISSSERVVVPLKVICSQKCAMPFCAGVSKRDPQRHQTPTLNMPVVSSFFETTCRPLFKTVNCVCIKSRAFSFCCPDYRRKQGIVNIKILAFMGF